MVRDEILKQYPGAALRVYVMWVPFLGGTQGSIDVGLMPDPRVLHFWDGDLLTSDLFGREVFGGGRAWDVYLLYGPDARWDEVPGPMVGAEGTVIGQIGTLREEIAPLLGQA